MAGSFSTVARSAGALSTGADFATTGVTWDFESVLAVTVAVAFAVGTASLDFTRAVADLVVTPLTGVAIGLATAVFDADCFTECSFDAAFGAAVSFFAAGFVAGFGWGADLLDGFGRAVGFGCAAGFALTDGVGLAALSLDRVVMR
jgi:hypothetical protein